MKVLRTVGFATLLLLFGMASMLGLGPVSGPGSLPGPATAVAANAQDEGLPVTLYFFWGDGCGHCAAAKPYLEDLARDHPSLVVADYEVWGSQDNQRLFIEMANAHGFEPSGVPTFFLGDEYWVGFNAEVVGNAMTAAVEECVAEGCRDAGYGIVPGAAEGIPVREEVPPDGQPEAEVDEDGIITLPIVGEVDTANQSLALTTALIGFVDGFNPCSLWVLSVLLALALRAGSRRNIVIIGLVFIVVTAFVYALFIAGIFTIFTVVSMSLWVRILVALVAFVFAFVNIKDYFWFQEGISFTIPEGKKPGIYRGIRGVLAKQDSMPAMIGGTVVLAAGVSVVELACTAGFPVMWTGILSAHEVSVTTFVLLLLLYMLIYQLDELAIFGAAVVTMRSAKLQEKHGRVLKLAGGMLMLSLGVVMLVDPNLMNSIGTSLLVFGAAIVGTLLVLVIHRRILPRMGIWIGSESQTHTR
ncbi:MAG TPA: thioredoxin family protein [Actinomycetaceae bacterium]|nr:thioredoxin family protein [Actinomycetaceae bacterium]